LDKNMWHWTCQMLPRFEMGPSSSRSVFINQLQTSYKPVVQ
jgi:hypothetical protein